MPMPTNEQIAVIADNMADDWQTTGWRWWVHNPNTHQWDPVTKFQAREGVRVILEATFPDFYRETHVTRVYDGVRAALMQNPLDLEPVD